MASEIYTSTQWENYPSTSTPITAAELNRMEKAILEVPKETATFLLNAATGGLKSTQSIPIMSTTVGTAINNYNPQNGDRLIVWKSNSIPCVENTDYTVSEEDGVYKVKAIGQAIAANLQIWNIPMGSSTQTSGAAYPNISSLTTDSISGTVTQGE
ncbi:MAG: hypothetical protein U0L58_10485 [Ruminococcus sp.]|nr:hypothetical protein [Ruminococcus sp.]